MGGQVTSNPNNKQKPVYYNGQAYMPETKGSISYIKVGNHIVTVDLNDPTWFQQQVHGDSQAMEAYKNENARFEEDKTKSRKWLDYYHNLIEQGKKEWSVARAKAKESAVERYTATTMLKKITQKREALLASSNVKKCSELSGEQRAKAENYTEQIEQYKIDKEDAGKAESKYIRERISADYQIQTACHSAISENIHLGELEAQQIVNKHIMGLA